MMITTFAICLAALASVTGWYFFWSKHAVRFQESGYTPPATSWFGAFGFACFSYLLTFLTVGKVKVVRKSRLPAGRVIFAANHQLPCDFAMVRRASGRHFRMLTAADQLGGVFGVLAAAGGVISMAFKQKTDGALAEQACKKELGSRGLRMSFALALAAWGLLAASACGLAALHALGLWTALALLVLALVVAGCPGRKPAMGIFPQGALLPDDPELKEIFRPGVVRIARGAEELSGESVMIVPMAIHYEHDSKYAGWTHRYLKGMRSMFIGMRNPKVWDPIFKVNLDELSAAERESVEAQRQEKLRAFKHAFSTNYRGVVVRGEPIDARSLPADPIEAVNVLHKKIAELLAEARTIN